MDEDYSAHQTSLHFEIVYGTYQGIDSESPKTEFPSGSIRESFTKKTSLHSNKVRGWAITYSGVHAQNTLSSMHTFVNRST